PRVSPAAPGPPRGAPAVGGGGAAPPAPGRGGGGASFPAEPSAERYVRGTAGIADAGKDTGDSQWFVMHSPAPHLEGRYTVIGHVPAADQRVVDALQVGDTIDRVVVEE